MRSLLSVLKNILNKLSSLDNTKTEMTLLWQNASPTSALGALTQNINTSAYDLIKFVLSDGHIVTCKPNDGTHTYYASAALSGLKRDFTVTSSTIKWSKADVISSSASGWQTNNNYLIPYLIYGIKIGGVLLKRITQLVQRGCKLCVAC